MKLIIDTLFLIVTGYFIFTFIHLLIKLRKKSIFPVTDEELFAVRKQTERPLAPPTYAGQKVGIMMYSILLLFVLTIFLIAIFTNVLNWTVVLPIFIPIAMVNAHNLLNLFAIVDDGVLSGARFVSWKHIHSFHFVPIDMNHKYYGYSKEVNDGYELKIKTRGFPISCIVISDEMKRKLTMALSEYVSDWSNEATK